MEALKGTPTMASRTIKREITGDVSQMKRAMQQVDNTLTVGSVTYGGSATSTWPNTWNWPSPTYVYTYTQPAAEEYANEVEIDRGDHDATLRFYRNRGNSRTLVKQLTVPLGVLDWLTSDAAE
jgi:hypothetical protein